MEKQKLLPFVIRNCDEGNFRDMFWYKPGVVCLDWTRQGNAAWLPPEAAIEWARQKSNLRDKKPRDLKAGLRNALAKKKELEKCKFPKEIEERDGHKFIFWKFKDLQSQRAKILNPPSKSVRQKKLKKPKNLPSQQDFEDNQPSLCSSTSDVENINQRSEKTFHKKKDSGKRGQRKKVVYAKQKENFESKQSPKHQREGEQKNVYSLPSITSSFFGGRMQGTSPLALQSQTISSTYNENWFPDTPESWSSNSQQSAFFPSGPTPPPQPNDVELPEERSQQWYPNEYSNYQCHIGFPVNQAQVQNTPQQSDVNFMAAPAFHQTSQLITSTSTHSFLNSQDTDECCPTVQEHETNILDVPTDKNSVTWLLQSVEVMNSELLPNEFYEDMLFDAVLNEPLLDNSITNVYSC